MKKIAFLFALALLATALISCRAKNEGGVTMTEQDRAAIQEATSALADRISEPAEYMLYETDGRVVAFQNGKATGVYDSKEAALAEFFDTSAAATAVPMSDTSWYICRGDLATLTYVAFGDSITYGIDGNYRVGDSAYRMTNPYPNLVGETLGLQAVRNMGVSGASFCPHPDRANMTSNILGFGGEADIISLLLGVNDFTSKLPLGEPTDRDNTTIYGCLHLISEHFKTLYPDAFIFYMTPFQYKNPDNGIYRLEDVANAVKTVAAEYDIPVLDMYNLGKYELEMNVSPNDGVHPSQQHHIDYTAPLICEFLARHYENEK